METTAGMRAGPIRLHVPAPQIPEFRLVSAPDSPSSFRARATAQEPAPRAHLTKPASALSDPDASGEGLDILDHNGNKYSVRVSMALIFQKNAALVLAAGESALVVLAYVDGVELLLITPTTPFHFDASLTVGVERTNSRPSASASDAAGSGPWPEGNAMVDVTNMIDRRVGAMSDQHQIANSDTRSVRMKSSSARSGRGGLPGASPRRCPNLFRLPVPA